MDSHTPSGRNQSFDQRYWISPVQSSDLLALYIIADRPEFSTELESFPDFLPADVQVEKKLVWFRSLSFFIISNLKTYFLGFKKLRETLPQVIYNPIIAMGFLAMFTI